MKLKLRSVRKSRKVSQEALGEAIGVEKNTISKYERHEISPTVARLAQIATVLKCSVLDLLDLDDAANAGITPAEADFLVRLRTLPADQRNAVATLVSQIPLPPAAEPASGDARDIAELLASLKEAMRKEGLPTLPAGTALRFMAALADRWGIQIDAGDTKAKSSSKSGAAA
jgi:transcriptional regulator with XRE-family HTH domain